MFLILFLLILTVLGHIVNPRSHVLPHTLLEGEPEGAVASVSAFACQLLGSERQSGGDSLAAETSKVVDAQIVDIRVVSDALGRKILAEIGAVGSDGFGQL